jgi:ABC-2 type transport system permease protein
MISGIVMWFVLGYAFYSLLYGALGALASRVEDAQTGGRAAHGVPAARISSARSRSWATRTVWWVTVGSLFPPTAPMFMPLRAALTTVPAWQVAWRCC